MSIVITGNPGVGKHTIAKKISNNNTELHNITVIDINKVSFESGLFEKSNDGTNDIDTTKLEKILKDIQKDTPDTIMYVGHLAPYVLHTDQIKIAIVLRRSPYDLVPVYKQRGYSNIKIKENTASEILGVIASDAITRFPKKVVQVNVSGSSITKTADSVSLAITNNSYKSDTVDWLGLVTENNDLKKFFDD